MDIIIAGKRAEIIQFVRDTDGFSLTRLAVNERIVWGSASRHGRKGIVEIIELRFALWEFLGCPGIIQNCLIREDIRLIYERSRQTLTSMYTNIKPPCPGRPHSGDKNSHPTVSA